MLLPAEFVSLVVACWVAALAVVVGYQLLTGKISTAGLLQASSSGEIDPERLQLLMGTIAVAAYYTVISLQRHTNAQTETVSLRSAWWRSYAP